MYHKLATKEANKLNDDAEAATTYFVFFFSVVVFLHTNKNFRNGGCFNQQKRCTLKKTEQKGKRCTLKIITLPAGNTSSGITLELKYVNIFECRKPRFTKFIHLQLSFFSGSSRWFVFIMVLQYFVRRFS